MQNEASYAAILLPPAVRRVLLSQEFISASSSPKTQSHLSAVGGRVEKEGLSHSQAWPLSLPSMLLLSRHAQNGFSLF